MNMSALAFATSTKKFCEPGQVRIIKDPAMTDGFPGFVFPYFPEMLTADPDSPFQHFLSLFSHCISNNAEEAAGSLEVIRRGFRFLASSHAGRVIQHIYFGIKLCIEMGGKLSLISDGAVYAGFSIEGKSLVLLEKNRIRNSFAKEDVERALEQLSQHDGAVKAIYTAVLALGRSDGAEENITLDECKRFPRKLRQLIQARRAVEIEDIREVLNEHVGGLRPSGLLGYHCADHNTFPQALSPESNYNG